jgi:hypothetical protein
LLADQPFGDGTLNKLGRNLAALAGRGENPVTIHIATMAACDAFKVIELASLVNNVAAEIRSRMAA